MPLCQPLVEIEHFELPKHPAFEVAVTLPEGLKHMPGLSCKIRRIEREDPRDNLSGPTLVGQGEPCDVARHEGAQDGSRRVGAQHRLGEVPHQVHALRQPLGC